MQILKDCNIGEREDLGTVILVFEHLVARTQHLLGEVQRLAQSGEGIPGGLYLRAHNLAHDFERQLKFLTKVRIAIEAELDTQVAKVSHHKRGWSGWVRSLLWPEPVNAQEPVEHHEPEHISSGNMLLEVEGRCRRL